MPKVTLVAENTKRIIEDRGLKKGVVAQKAGYTVQQFSDILNHRKVIKDVDIAEIAKALEVTPNDLFGQE